MTEETTGRKTVPDTAIIGIPARWLAATSQSFTLHRRRPETQVEEREVERVVTRAGKLALQQITARRTGNAAPLTVVDASLVALTVDGHRVTDPVNFRGGELGATVCATVALDEDLSTLRVLAEALELEPPRLVADPPAVARQLGGDGIVLDVGGASTAIYLTRYGKLLASDTLPLGGDGFIRSLAAVFKLTGRQVKALRRAYEKDLLSAEDTAQVQAALRDTVQSWLRAVEDCLGRMAGADDLPHQIHLSGGGSLWPDVLNAARVHPWMQNLHFIRYPQVQRLDPVQFPNPINDTGRLWDVEETVALSLACWPRRSGEGPVERALAALEREVLE
ncbi:MAG: hypothetical protein SVX38_03665 [Chloroflexota bacterium]|nr:hypothetical protein [Chloroflexota bacterium]